MGPAALTPAHRITLFCFGCQRTFLSFLPWFYWCDIHTSQLQNVNKTTHVTTKKCLPAKYKNSAGKSLCITCIRVGSLSSQYTNVLLFTISNTYFTDLKCLMYTNQMVTHQANRSAASVTTVLQYGDRNMDNVLQQRKNLKNTSTFCLRPLHLILPAYFMSLTVTLPPIMCSSHVFITD